MSYTEVTTSFKKIGLTQNSVQVAKLTMTVQYLQGTNKQTHNAQTTPSGGAKAKPNQTNRKKTKQNSSKIKPKKKKKKSFQHGILSINKYELKLNWEARKMTMLTVAKLVLASETKEEECWNLFRNEK